VKVNGTTTPCEFLISVTDGVTAADRFRIRIWRTATDGSQIVVYDNQSAATGATALQAGETADAVRTVSVPSLLSSVIVGSGGAKR